MRGCVDSSLVQFTTAGTYDMRIIPDYYEGTERTLLQKANGNICYFDSIWSFPGYPNDAKSGPNLILKWFKKRPQGNMLPKPPPKQWSETLPGSSAAVGKSRIWT